MRKKATAHSSSKPTMTDMQESSPGSDATTQSSSLELFNCPEFPVSGIKNSGGSSHINSLLQVLIRSEFFLDFWLTRNIPPQANEASQLALSLVKSYGTTTLLDLNSEKRAVASEMRRWTGERISTVMEFLRLYIQLVEGDLKTRKFTDMFCFKWTNSTRCTLCNLQKEIKHSSDIFTVNCEGSTTISGKFNQPPLTEDMCCDCNAHMNLISSTVTHYAPILVLETRRFITGRKDNTQLTLPATLNGFGSIYLLKGMVELHGRSPSNDYYSAKVKDGANYRQIQDDKITIISAKQFHRSRDSYLVFYERFPNPEDAEHSNVASLPVKFLILIRKW